MNGLLNEFLWGAALTAALLGCAKDNRSERDSRLEQIRNQAEVKRAELRSVAGRYEGILVSKDNERPVTLVLEVRDVPTLIEGEIDPVMIPTLAGFLQLDTPPEHTPFGIESSEFDVKLKQLTLVLKNPNHGDLFLNLVQESQTFTGDWLAPLLGGQGQVKLERGAEGS